MPRNTFEQVDEPQPDALNLSFRQTAEGQVGRVQIPAGLAERMEKDVDSGELPAVDAFRSAVQLANQFKLPVVVLDPDGVWHAEWGDLERYSDDEATPVLPN